MIKIEFGSSILKNKLIKEIFNNLDKKYFKISKFKVKENLPRNITKIYKEIKLINYNHYKFLITKNFKNLEEVEKLN